ncbi:MAG: ABC transporter substrate-binding protein, partial [Synergistaceae bacterium]|nr:ABC transporter substrate-binding protein [Synergistaceae bacterium]
MSKARIAAALVLVGVLVLTTCGLAFARETLIVYTSMKESLIGNIVEGFEKLHPDITVDHTTGGAGMLMTKIAAERETGRILADVLWHSEVPDFYNLRSEGLLLRYESPFINELLNPFDDYDGYFTAARLGTLGIIINTNEIKEPPTQWSDLFKPEFKDAFVIADPSLSGTAFMSVAMLDKQFGWEFFEKLRDNGASMGRGSSQVINDTAIGEFSACLGVDYIVYDSIVKGAPLALFYPPEVLMSPSPVTIFKDSPNIEAAKKFVDYLLSQEAQQMVANEATLSVRLDVTYPEGIALPAADEVLARSIKVDYIEMMD